MSDDYSPVEYISAQSAEYCALPSPTIDLFSFLESWGPVTSINFGTKTNGINELGTSTEVGLYFTSTPVGADTASATTTVATTVTSKGAVTCSSGVGVCAGAPSSSTAGGGSTTASGSSPATTLNNSAAGLRISGCLVAVLLGIAVLI